MRIIMKWFYAIYYDDLCVKLPDNMGLDWIWGWKAAGKINARTTHSLLMTCLNFSGHPADALACKKKVSRKSNEIHQKHYFFFIIIRVLLKETLNFRSNSSRLLCKWTKIIIFFKRQHQTMCHKTVCASRFVPFFFRHPSNCTINSKTVYGELDGDGNSS